MLEQAGPNPVTGVPVRRGRLDRGTETHVGEKEEAEMETIQLPAKGCQGFRDLTDTGRGKEDPPPRSPQRECGPADTLTVG